MTGDLLGMTGGLLCLQLLSLSLDGMTGGIQDKIRSEFQTQTYSMMLNLNVWSVLYLGVGKLV